MDFDSSAPDLEPLAKRARLDTSDHPVSIHSPIVGVLEQDGDDDAEDFYGDDEPARESKEAANGQERAEATHNAQESTSPSSGIPGLLMMSDSDDHVDVASSQLGVERTVENKEENIPQAIELIPNLNPHVLEFETAHAEGTRNTPAPEMAKAIATEDVMEYAEEANGVPQDESVTTEIVPEVAELAQPIGEEALAVIKREVEAEDPKTPAVEEGEGRAEDVGAAGGKNGEPIKVKKEEEEDPSWASAFPSGSAAKAPPDPEFLAAAEINKDDKDAEWRYDTSDAESTSSDSDSDSESGPGSDEESGEEEGYVTMDPEEVAKVLMQEEYADDAPTSSAGPLRTKNEIPDDEKVDRPNIEVVPEMKIEKLGKVESMVDNMVLIKASVSGDCQVLSEGSLLVLEDRSVIGVVADTLGRVEEPLYTVRFNNAEEIKELKVEVGKLIYYVPDHSTYVFTKPLRAEKGSDASNLYDEEAAGSEMEFSDDEAEAEYKKKKKETRKNFDKKNGKQRDNRPPPPPVPSYQTTSGPTTLNYDDEPYVPLQRPANLHEMASQPPPPPPSASFRSRGGRGKGDRGGFRGGRGNDRGRGGFRGRGNDGRGKGGFDRGRGGFDRGRGGDRGRGDRGRGGHDGNRGGRGGRDHDATRSPRREPQRQHREDPQQQQSQPQNQQYQPPTPSLSVPLPPQQQTPITQGGWSQPPQAQAYPFPLALSNFQSPAYGSVPNIPVSGVHVNPTFFGASQGPSIPPQQQQQAYAQVASWMQQFGIPQQPQQALYQAPAPAAAPQQQSSDDAFRALQNTLAILKNQQQQQQQQ